MKIVKASWIYNNKGLETIHKPISNIFLWQTIYIVHIESSELKTEAVLSNTGDQIS